jgi:hypothetical protein
MEESPFLRADVSFSDPRLVGKSEGRLRQGCAEAFEAAEASKNEELLICSTVQNIFDRDEWEW